MKFTIEVLNVPDMEMLAGAELLERLRVAVINEMVGSGHPFGSGYSVWAFHDD